MALLPHARNLCVEGAYQRDPDFTHILFIDDDTSNFNEEGIVKLIEADKDIIGGVTVMRKPPFKITSPIQDLSILETNGLEEVPFIGMAFTLIKRSVLDKMREETPTGPVWFTLDRLPREGFYEEVKEYKGSITEAIAFGQNSHIGAPLLGEDVNFCRKARLLGFKCWVHGGVRLNHVGNKEYGIGDAFDFVDRVPDNSAGRRGLRISTAD